MKRAPTQTGGLAVILLTLLATCKSLTPAQPTVATSTVTKSQPASASDVALWLTTPDRSVQFEKQNVSLALGTSTTNAVTITVDSTQTFQTMDGFGYTLTGGSASLLSHLKPADRMAVLQDIFSTDGNGLGVSYLRISIGASDLSDRVFTYNDLGPNQTDVAMANFSLEPEKADLLPILKQILAIAPNLKILGSSWTPPVWMKTNAQSKGGGLKPEFYDAYALYFVKYVQAMKAEGITIDAITVQNEPLNPDNNPSLLMQADEQANFIKKSLGPAFRTAGIKTKIIAYDHNADHPDYPITVLNDPDARQYVDGSAFHLYLGQVDAISRVHQAYPDKNLYFTEQWTGSKGNFSGDLAWHTKNLIVGAPRNWCRNVLEWNLAADANQAPHTVGGCTECLGALTINQSSVTKNVSYYIIAHASKFVRPGSVRIGSTSPSALPNVAYKAPNGQKVLIVLNESATSQTFAIQFGNRAVNTSLPAGAVGTYVW